MPGALDLDDEPPHHAFRTSLDQLEQETMHFLYDSSDSDAGEARTLAVQDVESAIVKHRQSRPAAPPAAVQSAIATAPAQGPDSAAASAAPVARAPILLDSSDGEQDESIQDPDLTTIRDQMTRDAPRATLSILTKKARPAPAESATQAPAAKRRRIAAAAAAQASTSASGGAAPKGRGIKNKTKTLQQEAYLIEKLSEKKWFDFLKTCRTIGDYIRHLEVYENESPGKGLQGCRIILVREPMGGAIRNELNKVVAGRIRTLYQHGAALQAPEDFQAYDEADASTHETFTTHVIPTDAKYWTPIEQVLPLLGEGGLENASKLGKRTHVLLWSWVAQRIKGGKDPESSYELGARPAVKRPVERDRRRKREDSTPPGDVEADMQAIDDAVSEFGSDDVPDADLEGWRALHHRAQPVIVGGYTDYLRRTYLSTLIEYLVNKRTKVCMAVWTGSKYKKHALACLRELSMPTGGPEEDERDGVMGCWTKDDTEGRDTPPEKKGLKDLEKLWKELEDEEGMTWGPENTVVITANPAYMAAQPYSYICAPAYHYKMALPSSHDQFLLMMISCIEELLSQSNFASYIKEQGWTDSDIWTSSEPGKVAIQDSHCHDALKICAARNIAIVASGSNQRKP